MNKLALTTALALLVPIFGMLLSAPALAETYKSGPGPHQVTTFLDDWTDTDRGRTIPVKIYAPADSLGPFPVIIFSHGLGGSREGYAYLGEHWASHGYVSVHLQHPGSDQAVWEGKGAVKALQALRKAAAAPDNLLNRPLDVSFALDTLIRLNLDPAFTLSGTLDLDRVGVAGHSFGAYTTLAIMGQVFSATGREFRFRDDRFKAALVLSPTASSKGDHDKAYAEISIPALHMTGTEDKSPIGDTSPEERRIPFDHLRAPYQYLVIFQGGDHMVFSGERRRGDGTNDPLFHDLIRAASTALWDGYLKDDKQARSWLDNSLRQALGAHGTLEIKE